MLVKDGCMHLPRDRAAASEATTRVHYFVATREGARETARIAP